MDETVTVAQVATASNVVLLVGVQEALGELVEAAKEGLLALSVGVGLGVLAELMEEEVDEVEKMTADLGRLEVSKTSKNKQTSGGRKAKAAPAPVVEEEKPSSSGVRTRRSASPAPSPAPPRPAPRP